MYVKDSVIEKQIENDLKRERIKGRLEEVEYLKSLLPHKLQARLQKLRGELELFFKDG